MLRSIAVVCCFQFVLSSSPVVRVEEGELAGTTYELPNGRIVNAFLGVPYAAAPIFKYRFKEPQHLKPWIGTWNATKPQSACLQIEHRALYQISGEEDCLYLNIYTPKLPVNGVSPLMNVMVYIHGGAFMFGTGGTIYPDYILQNDDLVFVSINYRLGVLGFFSTEDNVAPGNFGLKDQVAALKWVQRNIIHFGGNPAGVTIAGCSAGGASVHYHYVSPLSEGLFQKGVSLSGTLLPSWTLPRNVSQKSTELASLVGCPINNNTRDMVKCLQRRPARAIVEQTKNFMTWRYTPFTPFGPVVEPESPNAFLSAHPLELLVNGKVKDLPWMTSVTEKEGLYPGAEFIPHDNLLKELDEKWNEIAPNLLMYNYSVPEQEKDAVSDAIRKFYFDNKPISKESVDQLIQMLGDRLFYNEIFSAAKLHNLATKTNIFCYKFNYRGKYSLTNVYAQNYENYGSSHSDDLLYILKYLPTSAEETETDKAMNKFMSSIYVNFMKTGDPSVGIETWKPIGKDQHVNFTCLNIYSPSDLAFEDVSNPAISEFWKNTLPNEYPAQPIPVNRDEL
ncbi:esterase FE4-like [Planococcus citri]|uniref:esterase FE4-like n=1 Tax=Planococcus citri TaxID=170843 RepID=UPI0031F7D8AE